MYDAFLIATLVFIAITNLVCVAAIVKTQVMVGCIIHRQQEIINCLMMEEEETDV